MPTLIRPRSWGQNKPTLSSRVHWGHPLARGLVGFWAFAEGAGNVAQDSTGLANGRLTGPATWTPDAVLLNGSTAYVAIGNPAPLNVVTYTIMAWVKLTNTTGLQNIIFKGDGIGGQYGLLMRNDLTAGRWDVQFTSGGDLNALAPLVIGQWACIAATFDGTTGKAYRNGILTASAARSTSTKSNAPTIGADIVNGRYFNGAIRSISIHDRALTAAEIQRLQVEPYAFLRPPVQSLWYSQPLAGFPHSQVVA